MLYRQVRRRRASAWTRAFPAGALAIGGFGRSRWRLRRTRAGHIIINGYGMVVSPFDRLRSGRSRIDEKLMGSTASLLSPKRPTVASQKIAAARARDSVRRVRLGPSSGFLTESTRILEPPPSAGYVRDCEGCLASQLQFQVHS
jgi:hypothetical protein